MPFLDLAGLEYFFSCIKSKLHQTSHNVPYVATTNTAAGAALTGVCPELTELTEGQSIILHLSYAAGSNATLNLTLANGTQTGPVNCYYGGKTRLGTHYAAGNDIRLTYHRSLKISGSGSYTGWWAEGNYNTNTTYVPATAETNGLMSAADKAKLDSIDTSYIPSGGSYLARKWVGAGLFTNNKKELQFVLSLPAAMSTTYSLTITDLDVVGISPEPGYLIINSAWDGDPDLEFSAVDTPLGILYKVSNADGSAFAVPVDDWPVMIRMEYNITIY